MVISFSFHFLSSESDFLSSEKTTTPAASNKHTHPKKARANDSKMDRVLNIKANEIVRHNIIQLFDISCATIRAQWNRHLAANSHSMCASVILWPKRKSHFKYNCRHSFEHGFAWLRCFLFCRCSLLIAHQAHILWQCLLNTIICYWLQWKLMNLLKSRLVPKRRRRRIILYCI